MAGFAVANWALISVSGCGTDSEGEGAPNPASGGRNAGGSANAGTAGTGAAGAGGAGGTLGTGSGGSAGQSGTGGGGGTEGSSAGTGGVIATGGSAGSAAGGTGGASGTSGASGTGGTNGAGGTSGAGAGGTGGSTAISTEPNLKIAFIGDTATGTNYRNVLNLVKNEQAAALLVQGDMSYSADPDAWWTATEAVLGTSFPVFISRGNHDDSSWSGYLPKADAHLGGATRVAGAHDANYKTTFRGLVIATIRRGDPASNITRFLQDENHIWKICQWHENQAAMQLGGKGDEMGWEVYEACRQLGAIVETGHEHSYSRTRTLVDMSEQAVDSSCSGASALCVGLGRTFANVVGLGGNSVRPQIRCLPATAPYGCNGEWAFLYTSNQNATHGAQFITFNAGDPRRAVGYFKNVDGQVVDNFTITYGP